MFASPGPIAIDSNLMELLDLFEYIGLGPICLVTWVGIVGIPMWFAHPGAGAIDWNLLELLELLKYTGFGPIRWWHGSDLMDSHVLRNPKPGRHRLKFVVGICGVLVPLSGDMGRNCRNCLDYTCFAHQIPAAID